MKSLKYWKILSTNTHDDNVIKMVWALVSMKPYSYGPDLQDSEFTPRPSFNPFSVVAGTLGIGWVQILSLPPFPFSAPRHRFSEPTPGPGHCIPHVHTHALPVRLHLSALLATVVVITQVLAHPHAPVSHARACAPAPPRAHLHGGPAGRRLLGPVLGEMGELGVVTVVTAPGVLQVQDGRALDREGWPLRRGLLAEF